MSNKKFTIKELVCYRASASVSPGLASIISGFMSGCFTYALARRLPANNRAAAGAVGAFIGSVTSEAIKYATEISNTGDLSPDEVYFNVMEDDSDFKVGSYPEISYENAVLNGKFKTPEAYYSMKSGDRVKVLSKEGKELVLKDTVYDYKINLFEFDSIGTVTNLGFLFLNDNCKPGINQFVFYNASGNGLYHLVVDVS